jgi:CubicO group peptidase (beta-lactamase class C family)
MIGRRRFLGLASLGLASASLAPSGLFAQDPRPKGKARPKANAKSPADPGPALEADEQVNRILAQARTDGRRLPGMIGGIVRGEELASIGAVGVRKVGSPEPIRVGDLVHIGSCTKALTATMIGTLVDEGKLRWESTVAEVFPDWAGGIHPDYAAVTLDQLLRHRSGLPHDFPWWEARRDLPVVEQRLGLLGRSLRDAPKSKPGSAYDYSNAGYVLAGMMAERVAGSSWEVLMGRRLFGPLGMASAGFGPPGTRGKVDHAWGHRASGDTVEAAHEDNPPVMGPAGTVHCSLSDWARFASYHFRGELGGVRLLKPETLKALHTPRPGEEYAGGWIALDRSWAGGRALTHSGSNTLWYCTIWLAPARDFAILVATNAAGKPAEEACDQAVSGLIRSLATNERPTSRRR